MIVECSGFADVVCHALTIIGVIAVVWIIFNGK